MMDQRRALSIPFSVDKDNLMESPLKISTICLSSECGKLDRQVSWTAFAGSKLRHRDSEHKNGSTLMDHNHETMVTQQMAMRKPCLVLTDVLKTDVGKTYMEKIKQSYTPGNRGQMSSTLKGRDRCKEDPGVCRELRSSHGEEKKNCVSSKHSQTSSSLSQRSGLRRRSQNIDYEEDKEENKDFQEKIIGKSNGESYTFAEVVDCGLSVSWEPAGSTRCCDEFSPNIIKEKWTDPDKEVLRRKRNISGSLHYRTVSPKRHRKSVLRLNGEDGRDGAPGPADVCVEESEEDGDTENADRTIVQFTVGGDDGREVLFPIIAPYLEAGDTIDTQRHQESSQDSTTNTSSPTDPIVLSSDDEESGDLQPHCSPPIHTVIREQLLQEAVIRQDDCNLQDLQVLRVVVEEHPVSVALSPIPSIDHSCMSISFSTLYCGGYQAKANGNIMMADRRIIIPLKDSTEQVELMLMLDRKALRRYSVWEEQEMEMRAIYFDSDEDPSPAAVLVFCVSETAADEMQRDLRKLCVEQDGNMNTGTASPFILLTLRDPLEGMEGALLRSLLDIDCLNSLTHEQSLGSLGSDRFSGWEDVQTPVLCLDESIELIRKTGLDSHLLCLLGLGSPVHELSADGSHSDGEENNTPQNCPEVEPQKETLPELETTSEEDTGTEVKPEEDQKEEVEHPSETKEGPTPVYTLCHRRTKGSYSVSHCKPDSSWIKYKHQGLAHRLIQFPPPPLKGGITVTMEDLQCLDSGQFLNDVIIDFYLKYLLHNASAAVAERSHIFSSFFYKQLTRRDNASEGATSDSCQRQRRHQRVKTWTRHVDIFKKDFLFVPVNQEAHWYLVVICFHGLSEPKFEAWLGPDSETVDSHDETEKLQDQEEAQRSKSPNENTETPPPENPSDDAAPETENTKEQSTKDPPPGPVCCTEKTFKKRVVCKRPCILIMDSLKLSLHERVFKLLREYLQSEWEVRRGSSREFGPDQMKGSHCQVPRQDNSSDCGLYLLQYVESFLKDPVVHFDIPLRLERWFPRQQVRRKRDEIRDLILNLYRWQNLDSNR